MNITGKYRKTSNLQELKVVPNITKKIVSVRLLLQYGAEMEENLRIMNFKYKVTIMNSRRSSKYGIYYFHASKI